MNDGGTKKEPRHVRTTISVPVDLKKRMADVEGHFNWSAIASNAFESVLNPNNESGVAEHWKECCQEWKQLYKESKAKNQTLREALEYYADEQYWAYNKATTMRDIWDNEGEDGVELAQRALERFKKQNSCSCFAEPAAPAQRGQQNPLH